MIKSLRKLLVNDSPKKQEEFFEPCTMKTGPLRYLIHYLPESKTVKGDWLNLWVANTDEHEDAVNSIPIIYFLLIFREVYGITSVQKTGKASLQLSFARDMDLEYCKEFMMSLFTFWRNNRKTLTPAHLEDLITRMGGNPFNQKKLQHEEKETSS